jgi:hypothetical protein
MESGTRMEQPYQGRKIVLDHGIGAVRTDTSDDDKCESHSLKSDGTWTTLTELIESTVIAYSPGTLIVFSTPINDAKMQSLPRVVRPKRCSAGF